MPVSYTIECTLREPSIVTNEETEQADVPQNEHPPVFLSYRKLRFHTIRNAPRGSHCSGMEECRLRDPPQAENPTSQDSFLCACLAMCLCLPFSKSGKRFFLPLFCRKIQQKVEKPLDTAIKSTYTRRACIGRGFYFDARKLL